MSLRLVFVGLSLVFNVTISSIQEHACTTTISSKGKIRLLKLWYYRYFVFRVG